MSHERNEPHSYCAVDNKYISWIRPKPWVKVTTQINNALQGRDTLNWPLIVSHLLNTKTVTKNKEDSAVL